MILAFNVNSAMKRLVLGETWVGNRRMKAIRFWLINTAGRVFKTCPDARRSTRWGASVERDTS